MIKGIKYVHPTEILDYIINHPHPPDYVGFIANYKK